VRKRAVTAWKRNYNRRKDMMEFNGHTETVSKHVIEAAQEKKRCRQRDGIKEGDRLQ